MTPTDIIVLIIVALAIGGASFYIIRAKKKGQKCVGCPYAKDCNSKCSCNQK